MVSHRRVATVRPRARLAARWLVALTIALACLLATGVAAAVAPVTVTVKFFDTYAESVTVGGVVFGFHVVNELQIPVSSAMKGVTSSRNTLSPSEPMYEAPISK